MGMIQNREDLKKYLDADYSRYPRLRFNYLRRLILRDEQAWMKHYVYVLRHLELAINTNSIFKIFWKIWHIRLSNYLSDYVKPNVCEQALRLIHNGGGIYLNAKHIGENFTATTGVVIGKKDSNDTRPTIGKNVTFTLGSKAIGNITISDNVIVAPNSVVIKDVPSNSVVSGVPSIIIKSTINNQK